MRIFKFKLKLNFLFKEVLSKSHENDFSTAKGKVLKNAVARNVLNGNNHFFFCNSKPSHWVLIDYDAVFLTLYCITICIKNISNHLNQIIRRTLCVLELDDGKVRTVHIWLTDLHSCWNKETHELTVRLVKTESKADRSRFLLWKNLICTTLCSNDYLRNVEGSTADNARPLETSALNVNLARVHFKGAHDFFRESNFCIFVIVIVTIQSLCSYNSCNNLNCNS